MDASSIMMDGGGSSQSSSAAAAMTSPLDTYYFGDDVTDFDDFQRHMFGDDDELPTRGRSADLRSHLEDLANRHPEFADHLRSPPGWVSDLRGGAAAGGKWGNRSGSRDRFFEDQGQAPESHQGQGQEQQQQNQETQNNGDGASASGLSQHGLRNTVPDINCQAANEARNQRSMSAPPDSNRNNTDKPQQRFVSKIEINPVNPATGQTAADSKPPVPPSKQNMQGQPQHKTSTVRHIPIFVEGRDEPILPKNVDQDYVPPPQQQPPRQQQQQFTSSHQFQPQNNQHRKPSQPFQGHQQQHHQQSASPPPAQAQPQQNRPRDQTDAAASQPPPPPEPKVDVNDPIYKVQVIQKEVDALKKQIEAFVCKSRSDKEYIYLDEMLTRNLLKLDNISTEGKDNIRAVRKEAINSVQKCISLLESKVPTPEQQMEVDKGADEESGSQKEDKSMETNNEGNVGEQQQNAESADGSVAVAPKEENGPMEKVPKTDAQDNPNEIKC